MHDCRSPIACRKQRIYRPLERGHGAPPNRISRSQPSFYFTNPGWYDGGRRLLISSDREDRNVNLATDLVFKMTGCYDHFGVSRLYKLFIKDKRAIRHSVDKVLSSASAALCSGTVNSSKPTAEQSSRRPIPSCTPDRILRRPI